ncbi:hypothetical protein [Novosphingobium sp.]|uniref:hypothetical protein n=1 Tax=Novosphingobium sp. TaxID=1874826 RepID=UPI002604D267|nr:hypothetical protein [Novosphingobium sp.]
MKLRRVLLDLARIVADQAERDPVFAQQIAQALGSKEQATGAPETAHAQAKAERPKNRRPAAVLDPIAVAREGEAVLRTRLAALTLEQLKDVVADYGMDPGKLVMKWKDATRVSDRIVELAIARAQKGDAFRSD